MKTSGENDLGRYSELIAAILARLIDRGLARQELSAEDFFKQLPHLAPDLDSFDDLFVDSMSWLRDEGYVRFDSMYGGSAGETCVNQCAPTALCLSVLDRTIDALGSKTGREILAANRSGDESAGNYVKAGSLLGGILGGFTKSIG